MINDALLTAVDEELEKSPWRLKFTDEVESRFEADTQQHRSRNMVVAGLIAASIYSLFLINDYSFRPDSFVTAVQLRIGVMLPIGLTILWWVYRGVAPAIRETLMATTIVVAMLVSCLIFSTSTEPYSYLDVFSFGLILVVGNIIYPLRFSYACVSSGIGVLIMLVFIVDYDPMPQEAKRLAMFSIVAKALFTLFANYRLERSERTAYLLVLKEKIWSGYYLEDNRKLSRLSVTDPLTNIANRRQFDTLFPLRWQEAIDKHNFLGLMVIDIDFFKAYNDYYGHLQGDQCLRQVATTIQANSRDSDLVVRFGGEEFVVLMPNATLQAVRQAAERIRHSIEALYIPNEGCHEQRLVTVSIGAALLRPTKRFTPDDFLAHSDAALYEAKRRGRNCVWMANVE
ncbi:diguanylate cyclase [Halomonas sp. TD01]|uniref:GGDEF domain-containing protein n=1 Tax=Halomonas sp. TD01 TaxID=999141 RepID=UPI000214E04A|nr:diguanylate cyclase [Halomonas sp. TD01]EGP20146.1 diguanylate cyclase [Halomonas sp. TD01]CAH1043183.1 diguanylate cyclase [Halomonas sp. TD01]